MSKRVKSILIGVAALAVLYGVILNGERTPVSVVVRGFVTNRYAFEIFSLDGIPPDYVCAIIDVTNRSKDTFFCYSMTREHWQMGGRAPKTYYAYRDGGFQSQKVTPHSGFSFEALVQRGTTNEVTLAFMQFRMTPWPLCQLPASIEQKLPQMLRCKAKVKHFTLTSQLSDCQAISVGRNVEVQTSHNR